MADANTPLKATFFVLQKRDRAVLLPATIAFIVIVAAIVGAFVALNWGTLVAFNDLFQRAAQAPAAPEIGEQEAANTVFRMFGLMGSAVLFLFPLYVAFAAYEAACLRWMIRGEAPGLFGLTINNDTWRVYGVYWVWFAVQLVVSMAFSIVLMPMMFADMMEVARQPSPDAEAVWRAQMKMQWLSFLQYIPLLFLGIRLGPAAATSIGRRRFSFFEAWSVTSDRFFALLGSYIVVSIPFVLFGAGLSVAVLFLQFGSWPAILDFLAIWTSPPTPERTEQVMHAAFAPRALMVSVAGWTVWLLMGLVWLLFSYGINARAVLAALEEGKTAVDPAD